MTQHTRDLIHTSTWPGLSLWQPWATLLIKRIKKHETRSWGTSYRGIVVIHAAARWAPTQSGLLVTTHFYTALKPFMDIASKKPLPLGVLLGTAILTDCVRITRKNTPTNAAECAFGDYTPGRYRWDWENVTEFAKPIPFKGGQQLFRVPTNVIPTP